MPKILNFLSPRVLKLMQRIEVEEDREMLEQLFSELNALLNEDEQRAAQPSKKPPQSIRRAWRRAERVISPRRACVQ